jgi:hypothetical protein
MVAEPNKLELKVVSDCETSFASIYLDDVFFVKYKIAENDEDNRCKISLKTLIGVLKNQKQLAGFKLKLNPNIERLVVEVKKENGMQIKFKIMLLERETIEPNPVTEEMNE